MIKVAVVGASGFSGGAVTEELLSYSDIEVVPWIHNSGNAWDLARRGLSLKQVDLMVPGQIVQALQGCSYVVNCSRGNRIIMFDGLRNLLDACLKTGVKKFVHLSSVAVYGDPPHPDSFEENGPTKPRRGSYGAMKLKQDRMIAEYVSKGLNSIILCPPNIIGPRSPYLLSLTKALKEGKLPIVDSGTSKCVTVDVKNLALAAKLALRAGPVDGRRMFVTDDALLSWQELISGLVSATSVAVPVGKISHDALMHELNRLEDAGKLSVRRAASHILSGQVRSALQADPLWNSILSGLRNLASFAGASVEGVLRKAADAGVPVSGDTEAFDFRLASQQLRDVSHSSRAFKEATGYEPIYTIDESLDAFREWYEASRVVDTEFRDLAAIANEGYACVAQSPVASPART